MQHFKGKNVIRANIFGCNLLYSHYTWILCQYYESPLNYASIDVPYLRVRPNIASSPFIWSWPSKIDARRPEVLNCQWIASDIHLLGWWCTWADTHPTIYWKWSLSNYRTLWGWMNHKNRGRWMHLEPPSVEIFFGLANFLRFLTTWTTHPIA